MQSWDQLTSPGQSAAVVKVGPMPGQPLAEIGSADRDPGVSLAPVGQAPPGPGPRAPGPSWARGVLWVWEWLPRRYPCRLSHPH